MLFGKMWFELLHSKQPYPLLSDKMRKDRQHCKDFYASRVNSLSPSFIIHESMPLLSSDGTSYNVKRNLHDSALPRSFPWPVVPYSLRERNNRSSHLPAHRRCVRIFRDPAKHFYFPNFFKDASLHVSSCHPSNRQSSKSYLYGPLSSKPATSPSHRMSLDTIGLRTTDSEGYQWILVMINHFKNWIVAVPMREHTCYAIIRAFKDQCLYESYSCTQAFADRARELSTPQFRELMTRYGSSFVPGPPRPS